MYKNDLKNIATISRFFKGLVICNKTKEKFLRELEKINVKFDKNDEHTGKLLKIS